MGLFQGLNFVLLLNICRIVVHGNSMQQASWIPVFLAISGCLTANFLSEFGSTMGDNATALFCLAAILLVFQARNYMPQGGRRALLYLLLAGMVIGMGVGLKLTNAPYAVALCVGLLVLPLFREQKWLAIPVFGLGVLSGMGVMAGHWFYTMWHTFGNPLFPQFGNVFPNPLASSIGVADKSWLPAGVLEYLGWPFIISLNAMRVGQLPLHQFIWAIVYLLLIASLLARTILRKRMGVAQKLDVADKYILVVVVVGFALWMKLFSVYRYLVPMDLLAPLAIFILLRSFVPYGFALRALKWLVGVSVAVVLLGGVQTWGHESWDNSMLDIEVPPLTSPEKTTILITEGDPPWSWLATAYPVSVAFAQIEGNFPQGPSFGKKIEGMLTERGGPIYALFQAHYDFEYDSRSAREKKVQRIIEAFGFSKSAQSCQNLQKVMKTLRLRADVELRDIPTNGSFCEITLLPKHQKNEMLAENLEARNRARIVLNRFGLVLGHDTCSVRRARIGNSSQLYNLCAVKRSGF
jgi:hypothetical protein